MFATRILATAGTLTMAAALLGGVASSAQGSGVFPIYPVLRSMRWQGGLAQVVGTGMPR